MHTQQRIETCASNECPVYDIKTSDGDAFVLGLWGMWSNFSLPLLPGLLRVPSIGQVELFNHSYVSKLITDVKLNC